MAKINKSIGFSKAIITEEDGVFYIEEIMKDSTNRYNLTDKLKEWVEIDGISLTIKKDSELPSEE